MAKKTPVVKRDLLRSIGIDPYPGVTQLDHDQKSYVARLWRKYHEVADAPKGEFATIQTKRNQVIRTARESGYKSYRNRLFVAKEGYREVKLTKAGHLRRKFDESKSSTEYLVKRRDLPKLAETLRKRGLKEYEQVTAKFGSGGTFKSVYQNLADLEQYLQNFTPRAFRDAFAALDKARDTLGPREYEKQRAAIQRRAERERLDMMRSLSIVKIHDAAFVTDRDEDDEEEGGDTGLFGEISRRATQKGRKKNRRNRRRN
jgi:hypothetical protein